MSITRAAVDFNATLLEICKNITTTVTTTTSTTTIVDNISQPKCHCGPSVWYYIVAGLIIFIVFGIGHSWGRDETITELRTKLSYQLHSHLEEIYMENHPSQRNHRPRYKKITYMNDDNAMERTITIVEDLSWGSLPEPDPRFMEGGNSQGRGDLTRENATMATSASDGRSATNITAASDPQIRQDEGARLRTPFNASQGYVSVPEAEDSESETMSEVPPPPYLPPRPSVHDSDSEDYEVAHP